ncbi:23S rRNA (adenine(1618)-N(6))-methyltransferase RlmF [Paraglaciecola sp.]|uniref:23S rRNA (adenine(1618)-N(6))-methyltransferase RlmF n=1 Tax=Paraglaciecola sp. TaxID=1920173 RepID=UPI0030F389C2
MHINNLHKDGYDFKQLAKTLPELARFVINKVARRPTIDFSDPLAVKLLNQALLKHHYKLDYWDIPTGFLCPPVPGRADYIHHIADLLAGSNVNVGNIDNIVGLDIGVGANAIYPIVGSQVYGWQFVGSEVNPASIQSAQNIVNANPNLKNHLTIRQQFNAADIFKGVIQTQDRFSFTMCNPPFHANVQEASVGSQRKNTNLARNKQKRTGSISKKPEHSLNHLNFAGQHNELWCQGGEVAFIQKMIDESQHFATQVQWFTCLVSKKENLKGIYQQLAAVNAHEVLTINMSQGSKISRFVAWRF